MISTPSEGIHAPMSPGPPSTTSISQPCSMALPLVVATARGLTSQAITSHPRFEHDTEMAPLPHPISSNLRPCPKPSSASTRSSNIESSLGGYTVGAMVSEISSSPDAFHLIGRPFPFENSTSRSTDNSLALPRLLSSGGGSN